MIYRFIEKERFNERKVIKFFFQQADSSNDNGDRSLTLTKFAAIAMEHKLFSVEKQKIFAHQIEPTVFVL